MKVICINDSNQGGSQINEPVVEGDIYEVERTLKCKCGCEEDFHIIKGKGYEKCSDKRFGWEVWRFDNYTNSIEEIEEHLNSVNVTTLIHAE